MKKFIASASIAMAIFTTGCSQSNSTTESSNKSVFGPAIEFAVTEHDFGTFEQDGNGTFEFVFNNTGTEPLVLSNVRSSCGCTIPEWPKEPINAGSGSKITVSYDTHRIGSFTKTISVYSNASAEPIVLRITGQVNPKPGEAAAAQ